MSKYENTGNSEGIRRSQDIVFKSDDCGLTEIDPETPEGKNKYISIFNAALADLKNGEVNLALFYFLPYNRHGRNLDYALLMQGYEVDGDLHNAYSSFARQAYKVMFTPEFVNSFLQGEDDHLNYENLLLSLKESLIDSLEDNIEMGGRSRHPVSYEHPINIADKREYELLYNSRPVFERRFAAAAISKVESDDKLATAFLDLRLKLILAAHARFNNFCRQNSMEEVALSKFTDVDQVDILLETIPEFETFLQIIHNENNYAILFIMLAHVNERIAGSDREYLSKPEDALQVLLRFVNSKEGKVFVSKCAFTSVFHQLILDIFSPSDVSDNLDLNE